MVVIYGYSKVASQIAEGLFNRGIKLIIIEPSYKEYEFAKIDGYAEELHTLECYDDEDFEKIGLFEKDIEAFYCVHNDFNKNLFVTLSVRNLMPDVKIISLARDNNDEKKLRLAGASKVLNPYELTAIKIFRHIHRPMALRVIEEILDDENDLTIEEITISQTSRLDGEYLKGCGIFEKYNLVLLGLQDTEITHEFIFASRGMNHKIDAGDTIVVLGEKENIEKFKEYING